MFATSRLLLLTSLLLGVSGQQIFTKFRGDFLLWELWNPDFLNTSSENYKSLEGDLLQEISDLFSNVPNFKTEGLIGLRQDDEYTEATISFEFNDPITVERFRYTIQDELTTNNTFYIILSSAKNIRGIEDLLTQEPLSVSSTLLPSGTVFSGDLLVTSLYDGQSSEGILPVSSSLELLQSSMSDVVYDPSTRMHTFSTSSKGATSQMKSSFYSSELSSSMDFDILPSFTGVDMTSSSSASFEDLSRASQVSSSPLLSSVASLSISPTDVSKSASKSISITPTHESSYTEYRPTEVSTTAPSSSEFDLSSVLPSGEPSATSVTHSKEPVSESRIISLETSHLVFSSVVSSSVPVETQDISSSLMVTSASPTALVSEIQPTSTAEDSSTTVYETTSSASVTTRTPQPISQTTTAPTTTTSVPRQIVSGKVRMVNQQWLSEYENTNSALYRIIYEQVRATLTDAYSRSSYGNRLVTVSDIIFRPGSIIAEFSVTFSGEEEIDPVLLDQDINAFAQNLPEEFSIDPEFTSHEALTLLPPCHSQQLHRQQLHRQHLHRQQLHRQH